jgi:hypothetical protein
VRLEGLGQLKKSNDLIGIFKNKIGLLSLSEFKADEIREKFRKLWAYNKNSMEPVIRIRFSLSRKEIYQLLWNLKFLYRVYNNRSV